jgi:hypothetical protein
VSEDPDRSNPSVRTMIAAVAIGVATVILVFFAVGYLLGRLFL